MKKRQIKMSKKFRSSKKALIGQGWTVVPELRVSGQWLEKQGFSCGSLIEIQVENGRLVLTLLNDDGSQT
jgi:hypothetical protein